MQISGSFNLLLLSTTTETQLLLFSQINGKDESTQSVCIHQCHRAHCLFLGLGLEASSLYTIVSSAN